MTPSMRKVARIDCNFALEEATFLGSYCALNAFTAVYLSYRGFTDGQIGVSASVISALSILMQALVSNFCDHHMSIPIKRTIMVLFLIGICAAGLYASLPLPVGLLIAAYSVACSCDSANTSLTAAQLMQFNNVGINAHYGWPRGVGSFVYAVMAWVYGILAERYTPSVLPITYMIGTAVCIAAVLLMPNPYKGVDLRRFTGSGKVTSYRAMLKGNPTLVIFLAAVMLYSIGNSGSFTFTLRLVERLGGGTAEYGISEFARASVELPMLFISPLLLKKLSAKTLVGISFVAFGVRILAVTFAPTMGWLYAASTLNMFCCGIYLFASVILANSLVRMTEKVRAQGLVTLCGSIGSIIGNMYGGAMIEAIGLTPMMISASLFCFAAAAIILLCCHPERHPVQEVQS